MEALSAGRARVTGLPGREEVAGVVADGAAVRAESLERWRAVRGVLTANRAELGRVAARLYPGGVAGWLGGVAGPGGVGAVGAGTAR